MSRGCPGGPALRALPAGTRTDPRVPTRRQLAEPVCRLVLDEGQVGRGDGSGSRSGSRAAPLCTACVALRTAARILLPAAGRSTSAGDHARAAVDGGASATGRYATPGRRIEPPGGSRQEAYRPAFGDRAQQCLDVVNHWSEQTTWSCAARASNTRATRPSLPRSRGRRHGTTRVRRKGTHPCSPWVFHRVRGVVEPSRGTGSSARETGNAACCAASSMH